MAYHVRNAHSDDAQVIAGYNSLMAEETEGRPLDPNLIDPGVANILRDPKKGRYWVAEADGEVIGQIMVTYEWSDWRNCTLWWIQSVFVHPEHRRNGVFSALYRHVEDAAKSKGAGGLRLYVERDNARAQQTYLALGMIDPNYQVMEAIFGE